MAPPSEIPAARRCTAPGVSRLLSGEPQHKANDSGLVGDSEALSRVRTAIARLASEPGDVLIVGESGSGLRASARSLHDQSGAEKVVPIGHSGLAAVPDGVLEGTLIVADLTALGAEVQAELLRYTDRPHPRMRVVATLTIPEERAVEEGWLRRDLLERLEGRTVAVPPLRERREDIPALVEHFLSTFCHRRCGCIFGASEAAVEALMRHDWPGNVRELRDVVNRAVTTGTSGWIEPADLPAPLDSNGETSARTQPRAEPSEDPLPTLAEAEATLIRMALERADGNKSMAAEMLGISRHKLYDRLHKLGLLATRSTPSEQ